MFTGKTLKIPLLLVAFAVLAFAHNNRLWAESSQTEPPTAKPGPAPMQF